jgi:phage shock protein A
MALTSLETIAEKLAEKKKLELEDILKISGSSAIQKSDYGVTTVSDDNAASSLIFKPLSRTKLDNEEIVKAIDIEVKELKPNIPVAKKDLVPKPLYDEQVTLNIDLRAQVQSLNTTVADLRTQITTLESQVESEINNRLSIEQSNDALANQIDSLSKTISDFSIQIQTALQKSVEESILRASLQSQNVGFKAQIEALIKQIDSLNSIIEGLQSQLGAVQQQKAIQESSSTLAATVGGFVINEITVAAFEPRPANPNGAQLVGRFKSGGGSRWEVGGALSLTNNDTANVTVKIFVKTWPAGGQFFTIPESEIVLKAGENKKISFGLNEGAVGGFDSKPKTGWFGGHWGSQSYGGGIVVVSVTRESDGSTAEKEFGTAFNKMYPGSY